MLRCLRKLWENPGPDEGWSWIIIVGAVAYSMLTYGFCNTGGAGLLFSEILRVFDTSRESAMWPFSAMSIAQCVGGLSCGLLNSFCDTRSLLVTSACFCTLSFVLCFWATDVMYITFIFGSLFGFGTGLGHSLAAGMICKYFDKYRSTANGLFSAGIPFGGLLYPLLSNYILMTYNLRGFMLLTGGVTMHLVVFSLLMRPRSAKNFAVLKKTDTQKALVNSSGQPESTNGDRLRSALREYVDTLKQPLFYVVTLQAVICIHNLVGISLTLNDYLSDYGVSRQNVVTLLSVISFSDLVGRFATGFVADKVKVETRHIAMASLFLQGLCLFLLCATRNIVALFIIIPMMTFMEGAGNALANVLYCKYVGIKRIFAALSLKILFLGLCGFLRPFVVGICRDRLGNYTYYYFVLGSVTIMSSIMWLLFPCLTPKDQTKDVILKETKI